MNNLKSFDDFSNKKITESFDEENLSSGEKAALSKGMELMSEEQAAVCYLNAKGKQELIYRNMGGEGFQYRVLVPQDLANTIGMKYSSFLYAVKKFRILLGKEEQGDQSIYRKIVGFFDKFFELGDDAVAGIAAKAFTEEASIRGEAYKQESQRRDQAKTLKDVNHEMSILQCYRIFKSMYSQKGLSHPESHSKAVKSTAAKLGILNPEVEKVVSKEYK